MTVTIENMNDIFVIDSEILDQALKDIRENKIKQRQLSSYNADIKTNFDSDVQKAAMNILASSASGVNEGGGTLTYKNN
jgi:membrane peptidoglycan carboxypeptidase